MQEKITEERNNCFLPDLIGSVTDRGAVYLAGTYRSVGRGWPTGYLLPDSISPIETPVTLLFWILTAVAWRKKLGEEDSNPH